MTDDKVKRQQEAGRRPNFYLFPCSLFLFHLLLGDFVQAQDVVTLAPRSEGAGRIVMKGKVIDYTGALLTLEDALGAKANIPGKQVVDVQSTWTAEQSAGDDAWARRDFATAATKYQAALAVEPRRWVKRMIQGRLVAALRENDRWEPAAELFLSLVREDPATPDFATIPLPWTTLSPTPTLETKAGGWMNDRTSSVAALVGASFLLSTPARGEALRRLGELATDADVRIARLADAQRWRTAAVTADAATVGTWEMTLEKIPEPLRAGPHLVVGRAWASHNEPERAALQLLRVPILYGDRQPRLAAEAFWSAGQALERLARPAQAADLYRELLRDFPATAAAATARDRLKELSL